MAVAPVVLSMSIFSRERKLFGLKGYIIFFGVSS
jgi:hypothetical protein